jgi:hypothetical protein
VTSAAAVIVPRTTVPAVGEVICTAGDELSTPIPLPD